jgi:hypothetical protein
MMFTSTLDNVIDCGAIVVKESGDEQGERRSGKDVEDVPSKAEHRKEQDQLQHLTALQNISVGRRNFGLGVEQG